VPVAPRWFRSWLLPGLDALEPVAPGDDVGYQNWRTQALAKLPAGVFVWRADFEQLHNHNLARHRALYRAAEDKVALAGELPRRELEGDEDLGLSAEWPRHDIEPDRNEQALDFDPLIDPELRSFVFEGLAPGAAAIARAVLVERHEAAWPTIRNDVINAARNGLAAAAKGDGGKGWREAEALAWARENNRITARQTDKAARPAPADPWSGLVHKIK
jgi:hypothetical protein